MNPREINEIYNGFEIKDMSRQEFVKRMQAATSVSGMQQDLGRIVARKQTQTIMAAREKQRIDEAMKNGK